MRIRIAMMLSFLVVIGMSIPAVAQPDQPFWGEDVEWDWGLPNPCLDDPYGDMWHFKGRAYSHDVYPPTGSGHIQNLVYLSAWTDSGFSMPEKLVIGEVMIDEDGTGEATFIANYKEHYVLHNDLGQTLKMQIKFHLTQVDGDTKVEMFDWDIVCRGKK